MAQKSWFFNSAPGDPRVYQASDFAQYFGKVLSTGLLHVNEVPGLTVKAGGTDLRTYIEPGSAIMEGYAYENTANEYLSHSLPEVSLDRIDRVVLRLDKKNANRYIKLFVREGEPASSPVPPTLQRDSLVWELSLAQVRIRANTSTISPSDVFDERLDRTVAGLTFSLISKPSMADIQTGGYAVVATTEGQTDFEIPLSSFDKVGDGLTVYIGGKKAEYSSYQVIYPHTVRFNVGFPIGTKVEFEIIRGVLKLADDYVVTAGEVGMVDAGGYYESENVEGALQKIGTALFSPKPKVYGVKIDISNQDPTKAVERIDDAVGISNPNDFFNEFPFNKIKPCVIRNGVVLYYLNPNDFTKKEDGTASNVSDFLTGDVMIEFPKIYWHMEKSNNFQYVRYSSQKVNGEYQALAHQSGALVKDKLYISAYLASLDSENRLRSVSGKSVDKNKTLSAYRENAKRNGVGYDVMNYYQIVLLQILFLVQYADRNTKNWFSVPNVVETSGVLNTSGMNLIKPVTGPMKYLGLEQLLNNGLQKLEGFYKNGAGVFISNDSSKYNDTGVDYDTLNLTVANSQNAYTREIVGSNKGGFLPSLATGSSSTWYTDMTNLNNVGTLHFGSSGSNGFFTYSTNSAGVVSSPLTFTRLILLK